MEMLKLDKKFLIIDTSAIFSGKFLNINDVQMITPYSVLKEINPGGKDYRNLQFLIEKGLKTYEPSKKSIIKIKEISEITGDYSRLSKTDIDILALALDLKNDTENNVSILTDDYSIQNVSNYLKINYLNITQTGIKKRFIWSYKCMGCGKKFEKSINICPICGSSIKNYLSKTKKIN